MNITVTCCKVATAMIGFWTLDIFGASWLAYQVLFILVFADVVTGTLAAFLDHRLSSKSFLRKSRHLVLYFIIILSTHQLVRIGAYLYWVEEGMVLFLAAGELISILENSHKLGVPMPKSIYKRLKDFTGDVEKIKAGIKAG